MQFFSSSQYPRASIKQPASALPRASAAPAAGAVKVDCGWYDSSFDLARGLEVTEEDCYTLYQLWELSRH